MCPKEMPLGYTVYGAKDAIHVLLNISQPCSLNPGLRRDDSGAIAGGNSLNSCVLVNLAEPYLLDYYFLSLEEKELPILIGDPSQ